MDHAHIAGLKKEYERLSADGFRVLAIASKDIVPRGAVAGDMTPYSKVDECDLILNGYAAFLDPPKETDTPYLVVVLGRFQIGVKRDGRPGPDGRNGNPERGQSRPVNRLRPQQEFRCPQQR
jgi:hypothetical protein